MESSCSSVILYACTYACLDTHMHMYKFSNWSISLLKKATTIVNNKLMTRRNDHSNHYICMSMANEFVFTTLKINMEVPKSFRPMFPLEKVACSGSGDIKSSV